MREGKRHDLAGIRRIGHDFLVSGHRSVEAQFRGGLSGRAKPLSHENGSISKRKACGWLGLGSRHVVSPNIGKLGGNYGAAQAGSRGELK